MVALCSGNFLVYVFYGLFTLRIISFAQLLLNDCLVVVTRHVSPCPAHVIYALAGRGTHPMHTTGNAELGIRDGLPCMVLPPFIFYTQQCGCLGLRGHERSTEMQNWRWQGKAGGGGGQWARLWVADGGAKPFPTTPFVLPRTCWVPPSVMVWKNSGQGVPPSLPSSHNPLEPHSVSAVTGALITN